MKDLIYPRIQAGQPAPETFIKSFNSAEYVMSATIFYGGEDRSYTVKLTAQSLQKLVIKNSLDCMFPEF